MEQRGLNYKFFLELFDLGAELLIFFWTRRLNFILNIEIRSVTFADLPILNSKEW